MANKEEFDLAAIQELKMSAYKKVHCKASVVKKGKFALIFDKLDLVSAKKSFIAVFFNKPADAQKAFKTVKNDKLHLMKRTALAKVSHGVGADGKPEVTLDVVKGGLALDTIVREGQDLFANTIQMGLKVIGASEGTSDNSETSTDDKTKKEERQDENAKVREAKRAKRAAKFDKVGEAFNKIDAAKDTAPKGKLDTNVQKYEAILADLIAEANEDGVVDDIEQGKIDELTDTLDQLKKTIAEKEDAPKKLTPERRKQINVNMEKISARLEAITNKLGS